MHPVAFYETTSSTWCMTSSQVGRYNYPPMKMEQTECCETLAYTRVETLIVATNYLQLIQNRYMFRSFTVLQCRYQHCVQPVASDVEVVGYL